MTSQQPSITFTVCKKLLSGLLVSIFFSGAAIGHELDTRIGVTLEYDDNIEESSEDEVAELIRRPSINIAYTYEFTDVTAVLAYQITREDYRDDTYSDRTDVLGEATVDWDVIANRLSWNFYHNQSRVSVDSQLNQTPENLADRSVYRTTPRFSLISGQRSRLNLEVTYAETKLDEGDDADAVTNLEDNDLLQGRLVYQLQATETIVAGLSAQMSEISYSDGQSDYDNNRASLNIGRTGQSLSWNFDLGHNRIKRETADSLSEPYYAISADWTSQERTFSIRSNRELTDSNFGLSLNSDNSRSSTESESENGDGNVGRQEIVERTRHEISLEQRFQRGSFALRLTQDEQDFQESDDDERTRSVMFSTQYQPTQRITLGYEYQYSETDFNESDNPDDADTFDSHRVSINYQANQDWSLLLSVAEESREFDTRSGFDFDRTIALMTVSYQL